MLAHTHTYRGLLTPYKKWAYNGGKRAEYSENDRKEDLMPYIKDGPDRSVHIRFKPQEVSRVTRKAQSAGLTVTAYVREMALSGKVRGYNPKLLQEHTTAVGEVAAAVRDMLAAPHADRWAYEADIERMEDLLTQLVESERSLIEMMQKKLQH